MREPNETFSMIQSSCSICFMWYRNRSFWAAEELYKIRNQLVVQSGHSLVFDSLERECKMKKWGKDCICSGFHRIYMTRNFSILEEPNVTRMWAIILNVELDFPCVVGLWTTFRKAYLFQGLNKNPYKSEHPPDARSKLRFVSLVHVFKKIGHPSEVELDKYLDITCVERAMNQPKMSELQGSKIVYLNEHQLRYFAQLKKVHSWWFKISYFYQNIFSKIYALQLS